MKQIPGYPNYSITKTGRVWSKKRTTTRGGWLKPCIGAGGHLIVGLYRDNKMRSTCIHRLVLETYVGLRPHGMECRHLDGNPANNNLKNLKWGTHAENELDKIEHGTLLRGEQSGSAKLTDSIVILIRQLWNIRWMGIRQRELAEMFSVTPSAIHRIVHRRTWKHI